MHTYIPYSAIPEIAAQAAAQAQRLQEGSNNNTCPAADTPPETAEPSANGVNPCSSTTAAASNAVAAAPSTAEQQHGHPTTPRRSRSAPSFAELLTSATAAAAGAESPADAMHEDEDSDRNHVLATPISSSAATAAVAAASSSTSKQQLPMSSTSEAVRAASLNMGPATLPGIHTDDRFFYWLDEGSGRHVDLADRGVPRSKLESERVQYLTESERDQLEVTVDAESGLLVYKITGQTVHTGVELAVVQLKGSAAGDGSSSATGATATAAGQPLQDITEAATEEEEEEEQQSEEDQQQQSEDDEQQGAQQKQQRQQQKAALRQMQEHIRQPMSNGQQQHHQQQLVRQRSLQQQQQCCQESVLEAALPQQQQQQQQQGLAADLDAVMTDADAAVAAACASPDRLAAGLSSQAAATAAATPTDAAYGAVAGQHTPGTTGMSQRRPPSHSLAAAANQQQQQNGAVCNNSNNLNGNNSSSSSNPPGLLQIKEKPCKWIYVLDTSGRLFVHAKYRGKFHHSSFLQGGAVLSAGGIVVEHGRIMKLTADSGHYRPNFDNFMGTVQLLKDWGADLTQTKLSAKHIKCPQLPDLPPN